MIDLIKQYMTDNSYKEFIADYKRLAELKSNAAQWKAAMQRRHRIDKEPYIKGFYERLSNKYNYTAYKKAILNSILKDYIINDEELTIFFATSTYTGLLIETMLADELEKNGKRVKQNFYLDNILKCDIQCDSVNYQIKAITYLNYKDQIQKYKDKQVYFIFYITEKDNIYFITEGGKGVFAAEYVETMQSGRTYQHLTAAAYINKFIGKE